MYGTCRGSLLKLDVEVIEISESQIKKKNMHSSWKFQDILRCFTQQSLLQEVKNREDWRAAIKNFISASNPCLVQGHAGNHKDVKKEKVK